MDTATQPGPQDDQYDTPTQRAAGLFLDMTASWHALTLAEWQGRPDSELLAHYDAYLTSLGAYIKFRREFQGRLAPAPERI